MIRELPTKPRRRRTPEQRQRATLLQKQRRWANIKRFRKENREQQRRWREKNPERAKFHDQKNVKGGARRRYYQRNREKCLAATRRWLSTDRGRQIIASYGPKTRAKWRALWRTSDTFRMKELLRIAMRDAIRSQRTVKCARFLKLLGCSVEELRKKIASQFTDGMSWELLREGKIHIDHIIPVSRFDLADPGQQGICFHYSNLQPLWAKDNLRKGAKTPSEWAKMTA